MQPRAKQAATRKEPEEKSLASIHGGKTTPARRQQARASQPAGRPQQPSPAPDRGGRQGPPLPATARAGQDAGTGEEHPPRPRPVRPPCGTRRNAARHGCSGHAPSAAPAPVATFPRQRTPPTNPNHRHRRRRRHTHWARPRQGTRRATPPATNRRAQGPAAPAAPGTAGRGAGGRGRQGAGPVPAPSGGPEDTAVPGEGAPRQGCAAVRVCRGAGVPRWGCGVLKLLWPPRGGGRCGCVWCLVG